MTTPNRDGEIRGKLDGISGLVDDIRGLLRPQPQPQPEPVPPPDTYTVAHGDTLYSIAARFGLTVGYLAERNGITDPGRIRVGLVLHLTGEPPAEKPPVVEPPAEDVPVVNPPAEDEPPVTDPEPAPPAARPFFQKADWLWDPIPDNPRLDPASSAIARDLSSGARVLNTVEYAVTLRGPAGITKDTPRVDVRFTAGWGPDPFGSHTIPLPNGSVPLPPGGDAPYSVLDPTTGKAYALWAASDGGRRAAWGAMVDINGDGRETSGGSSTGSNIARHAGVITEQEMAAGHIPHALFFSSSKVGSGLRYPAVKTDQSGSEPLQEGMRIQLDPTLDLNTLNLSRPARVIAQALQTYGAYCGDGGGATVALLAEFRGTSLSQAYRDAGVTGDYMGMSDIPWSRVRVLAAWDGGARR